MKWYPTVQNLTSAIKWYGIKAWYASFVIVHSTNRGSIEWMQEREHDTLQESKWGNLGKIIINRDVEMQVSQRGCAAHSMNWMCFLL